MFVLEQDNETSRSRDATQPLVKNSHFLFMPRVEMHEPHFTRLVDGTLPCISHAAPILAPKTEQTLHKDRSHDGHCNIGSTGGRNLLAHGLPVHHMPNMRFEVCPLFH